MVILVNNRNLTSKLFRTKTYIFR